ncbi:MAG: hypothetical protein U1E65_15665 [Myxococcota bacterium]
MLPAVVAVMAIVTHDHASLRSEPRDASARLATLWQGDVVEVRGEKLGFVSVYDHRRERGGYLREWQIQRYPLDSSVAPELASIVRFLRPQPGSEAVGIAHAALYLKVAEAQAIDASIFDAIGAMADRLARRASGKASDETLSAHLEVVQSYGIGFRTVENEEAQRLCYDGSAFQQVLALGGTPEQRLLAVSVLSRPECAPRSTEAERLAFDQRRVELAEKVDPTNLPPHLAGRWRLLRASARAALAFDRARQDQPEEAMALAEEALRALASVDPKSLADDDQALYQEAALRVGAARPLSEVAVAPARPKLMLRVDPGRSPGERALFLVTESGVSYGPHYTFSVPIPSSAELLPGRPELAVAVMPLEGWRELWLLAPGADHHLELRVLSASTEGPALGYVELAGTSPDGSKLAVAREAREKSLFLKRFEIVDRAGLSVDKGASAPGALTAFYRWQSPKWRERTVSLR